MEKGNSLAMAYAMRRKAGKKMANGGLAEPLASSSATALEADPVKTIDKPVDKPVADAKSEDSQVSTTGPSALAKGMSTLAGSGVQSAVKGMGKMLLFAAGGLVDKIMAERQGNMKENYAEGGMIEGMNGQDQGEDHDSDDLLSSAMESPFDKKEDPSMKRRSLLAGIMKDMHSKHLGK